MTLHDLLLTNLETLIRDADHAECAALLGRMETLKALAWRKIMTGYHGNQTPQADDLLTMTEAAKRLSIPESRAYELARQGKLPAVKIGKYVRVSAQALADYQARLPKA